MRTFPDDVKLNVRGSWNYAVDTWYHIAVVRDGSNFYLFVDGSDIASSGNSDSDEFNVAGELKIGKSHMALDSASRYLTGYLDELRVSHGIARWTTSFTPPTAPYGTHLYFMDENGKEYRIKLEPVN